MRSTAAIILAAGLSSRMEHFKPLLSIGINTITDHLITTFLNNDVTVYLVVGFRANELTASIHYDNVILVENPNFIQGMFTSVQSGVLALKPEHENFFITPVDIPLIRQSTIKELRTASEKYPESIIFPIYNGKRGHPPLFPKAMMPHILRWKKDGSLRDIIRSYSSLAIEIAVEDSNILLDVDTPDDYRLLQEKFADWE